MAKHNIYVGVKEDLKVTTSVYPVDKNDHVTFHNRGPGQLTVKFSPGTSPLCIGQGAVLDPILVPKGGVSEQFKVCKGAPGDGFAYTAQIEGYAAEDPIVIIEAYAYGPISSLLKNPIVIIEAAFIVVALAAGYGLGKWHAARKAPASAGRP